MRIEARISKLEQAGNVKSVALIWVEPGQTQEEALEKSNTVAGGSELIFLQWASE